MFREQPVASKICAKKWREESYRKHQEKLRTMKPRIDNKSPKEARHLYRNLKKLQLEKERYEKMRRENQILLGKMTEILQKDPKVGPYSVNNYKQSSLFKNKSLNKEKRRRELMRITAENQALLKRIQQKQPFYNHLEWEEDRRRNEKYLKNICEYPYILTQLSPPRKRVPKKFGYDEEMYTQDDYEMLARQLDAKTARHELKEQFNKYFNEPRSAKTEEGKANGDQNAEQTTEDCKVDKTQENVKEDQKEDQKEEITKKEEDSEEQSKEETKSNTQEGEKDVPKEPKEEPKEESKEDSKEETKEQSKEETKEEEYNIQEDFNHPSEFDDTEN